MIHYIARYYWPLVFTTFGTRNLLNSGGIHALYLRTNLPVLSSMDSQTGGISQTLRM
eukprot:SAG22_NODE_18367_length_288_cov_1.100529_2_plen_56_part_01